MKKENYGSKNVLATCQSSHFSDHKIDILSRIMTRESSDPTRFKIFERQKLDLNKMSNKSIYSRIQQFIESKFDGLTQHLASTLGTDVDTIKEALDSFEADAAVDGDGEEEVAPAKKAKSSAKTSAKTAPAKTAAKAKAKPAENESHECEYLINPKDKKVAPHLCGHNAKNELDGAWYCGTENGGHYKSVLGSAKKTTPKATAAAKVAAKVAKSAKASAVIAKVAKKETINLHEMKPGSNLWVEPKTKIVFDKETDEAIGVLDAKNNVQKLGASEVSYLETHSLNIREGAVGTSKSSKTAKVVAKVAKTTPKTAPKTAKTTAKSTPKTAKTSKTVTPAAKTSKKVVKPEPEDAEAEPAVDEDAEDVGEADDEEPTIAMDAEEDADVDAEEGEEPNVEETAEEDGEEDVPEEDEGEAVEDDDGEGEDVEADEE